MSSRGYWRRRQTERLVVAEARRPVARQTAPDGWHLSDSGNLVTTRRGLRITVYQHTTQGWSFIRSTRRQSFSAHGFPTKEAAMGAALELP